MGPKLLSHNLKSLTAKEVPVYNTILYNWPNISSPVFTVRFNHTEAWADYNAGYHHSKHHVDLNISPSTAHNLSRTPKTLKVKLEMRWHGTLFRSHSVRSRRRWALKIYRWAELYFHLFVMGRYFEHWIQLAGTGKPFSSTSGENKFRPRLVLIQLRANGPIRVRTRFHRLARCQVKTRDNTLTQPHFSPKKYFWKDGSLSKSESINAEQDKLRLTVVF